jgi:VWFA-related protein
VVLLDLLNEWHSTGAIGSFEIGKALQRLEPNERLSLYLLTRRAEIYPVYTLQRAEADVADSRPPWTRTAPTLLDAAMRSVPGTRSGALADAGLRFDPTIQLLRTLAAWMMAVPGYKNLIWITHGVPLSVHDLGAPLDLSAYVRQLAAAMVRSHINVYSVDQSAQGAGGGFDVSADMLREISNWTGGRELASDRADDAIEEAIHDARGSYVLAYERTAQKHPPEYLKLRVICDRKGTHVLSRAGEVDAASAPLSDQEELDLIDASARAPLDSSDIGVNARLSASGASPSRAHLDIQVDARDLFLRQGVDGRFQGRLYRVLAGFDEDGLKELPPPEEWNVNLTAEEYQKGLRDGIDLATDVYPHQGIQKIRCLVMDRELNVTGSVTIPIPGRGDPSGH